MTRCLHIRASLPHGHGHRAPHLVTPPEPYPLATQAKVEPSSIRSTANFVKAVDSVPRGVLQRASLVGRAVLAAPQPGLAPLGNPGERPSRLAASGSHMVPPSACAHPILCTHPVHPPCAPCAPCAPRLFDPLKSVLFPLLIVAVALRINQCGDGARAVLRGLGLGLGVRVRHQPVRRRRARCVERAVLAPGSATQPVTPSGPGRRPASSGLLSALVRMP